MAPTSYIDVEELSDNSSSSESDEQESIVVRHRKVWLGLGVLTIGSVFAFAAVGVFSDAGHGTAAQDSLGRQVDQQIVTSAEQPRISIAEFVKSRKLSDVAAPAFDAKCPMFKPDCDLGEHFNAGLHKEMKALSDHDPEFANQLHNTTMTVAQQRIIMELLPLAHDKNVIDLGDRIATTVKRWAAAGEEVVHAKVEEALTTYSKERGIAWSPPVNRSTRVGKGAWKALMNPKMLAMIGGDDSDMLASRRLFEPDPMVVLQSVLGVGSLLRLILFVFQILHKTDVVILPLWLKGVIMWGNLVTGAITCLATILLWCPILFLQYWFNAWLLFSGQPKQLEDWHIVPFGHWMRNHLPGFEGKRQLLLAMDPRMAA